MLTGRRRSVAYRLLSLSLLLKAAALLPEPVTAARQAATTAAFIGGEALIESVDLMILESFPVQVHAVVRGVLGDGCTSLDEITRFRRGNTFEFRVTTRRPADAVCTLQPVPFEEVIRLDVAGLPAGVYLVNVNGIVNSFELSVDNELPLAPGAIITGEVMVENLELILLESFPVQVQALVKGNLPDGCTKIDRIIRTRKDYEFEVTITTIRPAGAMCSMALVPFEEKFALDAAGLKAGTYTVTVHGLSRSFELTADNVSH